MVEIIPAIMPENFQDVENKLSLIASLAPIAQIDVMDGRLTPKKTWPYTVDKLDENFSRIINEEEGFPLWNDIDFEVDLMVREPEKVWRDWVVSGAKRLIFHIESITNPKDFLDFLRKNSVSKDSPLYTQIGMALNISTPNDELYQLMNDLDFVQFMGIAEIGFQGNDFDPRVFKKIEDLRERFSEHIISVDGGVNLDNAEELVSLGVSRLAVGSAIFGQEDPLTALKEFQNLFPAKKDE